MMRGMPKGITSTIAFATIGLTGGPPPISAAIIGRTDASDEGHGTERALRVDGSMS